MPIRVLVTGGSGFVGSAVISELTARGYSVNALSHRRGIKTIGDNVQSIGGDIFDNHALDEGMRGCQAVIHLVGIIMERPGKGITFDRIHYQGAKNVIDAALRNGIKRFLHMSALGVRQDAVSNYHKTKFLAEQYLRHSGLDWTIFRPSMIHGPGGEFMKMETNWARKKSPPFFFMPYFRSGLLGRGEPTKIQPVHVADVARAFVDALENPKTIGEVYPLGGADQITWPRMHQIVAEAVLGHKRLTLGVPAWYAKMLTHIIPQPPRPFNRDQVIMSQEENTCDLSKFTDVFGWTPRGFKESLAQYAGQL